MIGVSFTDGREVSFADERGAAGNYIDSMKYHLARDDFS